MDELHTSRYSSRVPQVLRSIPWVRIIIWILLIGMVVFTIMPLLFMLTASFMTSRQIVRMPFKWIPENFYLNNFLQALKETSTVLKNGLAIPYMFGNSTSENILTSNFSIFSPELSITDGYFSKRVLNRLIKLQL